MTELRPWGKGKKCSKAQWCHFALQFFQNNLYERDGEDGSLHLTNNGWKVNTTKITPDDQFWGFPVDLVDMDSENNITVELNTYKPDSDEQYDYDPVLFERLRHRRSSIAEEDRIKASQVLPRDSLKEIATQLPQTSDEFNQIHGIGKVRMKYADDFLPIIRAYCEEHNVTSAESETEGLNTFESVPEHEIASAESETQEPNTSESVSAESDTYSPELFEQLRDKRKTVADREGVPAFVIFWDKTLKDMATYFPRTEEEFMQIHRVSPNTAEKYANDFLPIIRAYCEEHRIDSTETKTGDLNTNNATSKKRDEYAHDLFKQLQDKCKTLEKAEQEGIFTDGTLREMATSFPRTREAFAQIRGVSLRKMEKYADDFLPIIRDYCGVSETSNTYDADFKELNEYSQELFERLQDKHNTIADEEGVAGFLLFWDEILKEMATYFPQTEEEFRQINGIGSGRAEKYADTFLPIIRDYCQEHSMESVKRTIKAPNEYAQELFERLQDKCRILAKAAKKGFFTNRTLMEMATHLPRTRTAFRRIHGIGPVKTEKYADDFLPIIRAYCEEHGIE